MSEKQLSPKWQTRFDHFTSVETMSKEERKATYRKAPLVVKFNCFAFFFGFIYFLILGLWRKGLTLLGLNILISALAFIIFQNIDTSSYIDQKVSSIIMIAFSVIHAQTANLAYYLHIKKGSKSWNPYEGWKDYF